MDRALALAQKAANEDEVPVGAVIVRDGQCIGEGYNRKEQTGNPVLHAEILAIEAATTAIGDWRLTGATCYVTLEPCPMCIGALLLARVESVVFGVPDPKFGACGSVVDLSNLNTFNHQINKQCIDDERCATLLKNFFRGKRSKKK